MFSQTGRDERTSCFSARRTVTMTFFARPADMKRSPRACRSSTAASAALVGASITRYLRARRTRQSMAGCGHSNTCARNVSSSLPRCPFSCARATEMEGPQTYFLIITKISLMVYSLTRFRSKKQSISTGTFRARRVFSNNIQRP